MFIRIKMMFALYNTHTLTHYVPCPNGQILNVTSYYVIRSVLAMYFVRELCIVILFKPIYLGIFRYLQLPLFILKEVCLCRYTFLLKSRHSAKSLHFLLARDKHDSTNGEKKRMSCNHSWHNHCEKFQRSAETFVREIVPS